ncbi:hypothetical protein D3C74_274080 [compost metagenome]
MRNILGEGWRYELHRVPGVLRVEQQRAAERDVVGDLGRPGFVEFVPGLPAEPVLGAGQEPDEPVPGAVEEDRALKADAPLRAHHPAGDGPDLPRLLFAVRLDLVHVGVQV